MDAHDGASLVVGEAVVADRAGQIATPVAEELKLELKLQPWYNPGLRETYGCTWSYEYWAWDHIETAARFYAVRKRFPIPRPPGIPKKHHTIHIMNLQLATNGDCPPLSRTHLQKLAYFREIRFDSSHPLAVVKRGREEFKDDDELCDPEVLSKRVAFFAHAGYVSREESQSYCMRMMTGGKRTRIGDEEPNPQPDNPAEEDQLDIPAGDRAGGGDDDAAYSRRGARAAKTAQGFPRKNSSKTRVCLV